VTAVRIFLWEISNIHESLDNWSQRLLWLPTGKVRMIKENWHLVAVIAAICLGFSGCAAQTHGTVLPKGEGVFHVVEKGKTESETLKMAQQDAEVTCKKHTNSRSFVTVDHSSEYVGVDVDDGETTTSSIAANVVEYAGRMHSRENYKVEMTFKCA